MESLSTHYDPYPSYNPKPSYNLGLSQLPPISYAIDPYPYSYYHMKLSNLMFFHNSAIEVLIQGIEISLEMSTITDGPLNQQVGTYMDKSI